MLRDGKVMAGWLAVVAACATAVYLETRNAPEEVPGFVSISSGALHYQRPGEFSVAGKPVSNPAATLSIESFSIMIDLVSVAEFKRCIADGACAGIRGLGTHDDHPAVNVSWRDATAYAAWLSRKTGRLHRLPSAEEWAHAAAERASTEAPLSDSDDPAQRWLERYEREYANGDSLDATTRPQGAFGRNSRGISDLGGNVWEWTDTCYTRHASENADAAIVNCGVRVVEGRHRAYVTDFVRDARSGGCASGKPPANLGFRLVRENTPPRARPLMAALSPLST